jgi:hypothetical protein
VVYLVGNHDAEVWWNPQIQRSLNEAGLVDVFGLSYTASFTSLPEQPVYCEHGNQFDPANTIVDYTNPLDTPVGTHVLTEMIRPIGSWTAITVGLNLQEVSYVFPVAAHPGPRRVDRGAHLLPVPRPDAPMALGSPGLPGRGLPRL